MDSDKAVMDSKDSDRTVMDSKDSGRAVQGNTVLPVMNIMVTTDTESRVIVETMAVVDITVID